MERAAGGNSRYQANLPLVTPQRNQYPAHPQQISNPAYHQLPYGTPQQTVGLPFPQPPQNQLDRLPPAPTGAQQQRPKKEKGLFDTIRGYFSSEPDSEILKEEITQAFHDFHPYYFANTGLQVTSFSQFLDFMKTSLNQQALCDEHAATVLKYIQKYQYSTIVLEGLFNEKNHKIKMELIDQKKKQDQEAYEERMRKMKGSFMSQETEDAKKAESERRIREQNKSQSITMLEIEFRSLQSSATSSIRFAENNLASCTQKLLDTRHQTSQIESQIADERNKINMCQQRIVESQQKEATLALRVQEIEQAIELQRQQQARAVDQGFISSLQTEYDNEETRLQELRDRIQAAQNPADRELFQQIYDLRLDQRESTRTALNLRGHNLPWQTDNPHRSRPDDYVFDL